MRNMITKNGNAPFLGKFVGVELRLSCSFSVHDMSLSNLPMEANPVPRR